MIQALLVMAGGAAGALSRWGADRASKHLLGTGFPFGILFVNVLGCFLFGLYLQWELSSGQIHKNFRLLATTGFMGAFTTFSTFGYDTFAFLQKGNLNYALLNMGANLVLGLLAVWGGVALARFIFQ